MSIPQQDFQATFFDATFLAQDLFDSKDRYEIFRKEVQYLGAIPKYWATPNTHL